MGRDLFGIYGIAGNGGHKMYETIDGNATKMNSRYLAITNAYLPGEDD